MLLGFWYQSQLELSSRTAYRARNVNENRQRSPDWGRIIAYSLIGALGLLALAPLLAVFHQPQPRGGIQPPEA